MVDKVKKSKFSYICLLELYFWYNPKVEELSFFSHYFYG